MKKLFLTLAMSAVAIASLNAKEITKNGFLTTDYCADRGYFADCKLENYVDEKQSLVLYVHDELEYYHLDISHIERAEVDEGFARNGVEITGDLNTKNGKKTIIVSKYKSPPPPAKSFFKGCL
ncbi:MAG: hypothetical protein QG567_1010 [Campylobacterota bacterium]|nr:hypothetical protein [Campylobacterota bacterium]